MFPTYVPERDTPFHSELPDITVAGSAMSECVLGSIPPAGNERTPFWMKPGKSLMPNPMPVLAWNALEVLTTNWYCAVLDQVVIAGAKNAYTVNPAGTLKVLGYTGVVLCNACPFGPLMFTPDMPTVLAATRNICPDPP